MTPDQIKTAGAAELNGELLSGKSSVLDVMRWSYANSHPHLYRSCEFILRGENPKEVFQEAAIRQAELIQKMSEEMLFLKQRTVLPNWYRPDDVVSPKPVRFYRIKKAWAALLAICELEGGE